MKQFEFNFDNDNQLDFDFVEPVEVYTIIDNELNDTYTENEPELKLVNTNQLTLELK